MKVYMAYFSATGNTAKIAEIIKEKLVELGAEVHSYDITPSEKRQEPHLDPYDAVIFGFPVYSNRSPRLVREWLQTLDGNGKLCSIFCTYGGFGVNPVNFTTKQILDERGFVLVSAAEFLGAHTFNLGGWQAVPDRPDESDFDVAREFALKTYRRFSGEDSGRIKGFEKPPYSDTELDDFEKFRFLAVTQLPTRGGGDCSMCMECEEMCPTGAMSAVRGSADEEKCIVCLRCVACCPDGVLQINDLRPLWPIKLQMENETEETVNAKKSRIFL